MTCGRTSTRLVLGLALAIGLDTATQLIWKTGAAGVSDGADFRQALGEMARQPAFLAVGALMVGQYLNWMTVLKQTDLSYAHSIVSLSYVTVALCSALLLGEHLDPVQMLGIGLILAGVWFVGVSGRAGARLRRQES